MSISNVESNSQSPSPLWQLFVMPFPLAMLILTLCIGLAAGLNTKELVQAIGEGFGTSLGEIAMILIPSFILASAISQASSAAGSGGVATLLAPLAGAGMVCPDTAYAALSPVAENRKLSVLFGSYAGFKLLVPAGPAIVASMLGGLTPLLIGWATVTFFVCWAVGLIYARCYEESTPKGKGTSLSTLSPAILVPMIILVVLIAISALVAVSQWVLPAAIDFLFSPKGALIAAAIASLTFVDANGRATAFESGISRTAPLLLVIGAASALGAMVVLVFPFQKLSESLVSTGLVIPSLFLLTASFKLAKGSSMATYAGTGGLVSALLPTLNVSPEAAALAMCAGAFVTIAPNDSLYWLVRQDAFSQSEGHQTTKILGIGAALQGLAAFAVVQLIVSLGLI